LETTNEAYAIAKIAGLKLCQYYRQQYGVMFHSAMPTNLYGPGDNYHAENSHVLPALIRRFHEATVEQSEEVVIWGTGKPRREFLHVDDLAEAVAFLLRLDSSILELAKTSAFRKWRNWWRMLWDTRARLPTICPNPMARCSSVLIRH
jgi:nucleoside-diphosphate-sugar epimerase